MLPAFAWSDGTSQTGGLVQHVSTRHGNLVRVYLERPWWSSGDGELLGVVLWALTWVVNRAVFGKKTFMRDPEHLERDGANK